MADATQLIDAIRQGKAGASDQLLPLLYDELRSLAKAQMFREKAGHTLQATALVHEAYLRLIQNPSADWDGRRHLFAAAAEAMRRILIEHARRRDSLKRGGDWQRVDQETDELPAILSPCDQVEDLLALDEALDRFAAHDPDKAELVKLLYFAGLNLDDAAATMGISRSTAHRHWLYARAWLFDAMGREGLGQDALGRTAP